MTLTIWDCRKNEEYTLQDVDTKNTFSNIKEEFVVAEVEGLSWSSEGESKALEMFIQDSGVEELMVVYHPWGNITLAKEQFKKNFIIKSNSTTVFVNSVKTKSDLTVLLKIRKDLGGNSSGEWIFYALRKNEFFIKEQVLFSDVLNDAKHYELILYLAEMNQTFLIIRPSNNVDRALEVIKSIAIKK